MLAETYSCSCIMLEFFSEIILHGRAGTKKPEVNKYYAMGINEIYVMEKATTI